MMANATYIDNADILKFIRETPDPEESNGYDVN